MTIDATRIIDPLGAMAVELQAALRAGDYPGAVVRGGDLRPGDTPGTENGTAIGLVILRHNGGSPRRRVGVQDVRVVALCFGPLGSTGPEQARMLALSVAAWFHDRGPRRGTRRRPLFSTAVVSYGTPTIDPDTKWPTDSLVISAVAGLIALPA